MRSKLLSMLSITRYLAVFVSIALVAFTLVALRWTSESINVIEASNLPFPVRTIREHPTGGGVVILQVSYCKHKALVGRVRTSFVSPLREIFVPVTEEKSNTGCVDTEVPVILPKGMPADTYKVKYTITYDVNPFKKDVLIEFSSKPFVVDKDTNIKIDSSEGAN